MEGLPEFLHALANSPVLQYGPLPSDPRLIVRPQIIHRWASEVEALRQRPGAQATSTAALPTWDESRRVCNLPDVDEAIRNLLDDPTEDNATCLVRAVLAAPSTGGAETAELDNRRDAFEGYLRSQGFEPRRNGFGYHGNNGHDWLTWLAAIRASSAPAQAVETAGVREAMTLGLRALDLMRPWSASNRKLDARVVEAMDAIRAVLQSPAAATASKEQ